MASPIVLSTQQTVGLPVSNTGGKTFASNYFKLAVPNLSAQDRLAIRVLAMVYAYRSVKDYTSAGGHNLLITDGVAFTRGISNFDLDVALTTTDWWAGYNTDNVLTNDPVAMLKEAQDFKALSAQTLGRILAFLKVQIGQ